MIKRIGLLLISSGVIVLLSNTSDFDKMMEVLLYYTELYWPVFLIAVGVFLLAFPKQSKKR